MITEEAKIMFKAIEDFKKRNPNSLDFGCGTGAIGVQNELIGTIINASGLVTKVKELESLLTDIEVLLEKGIMAAPSSRVTLHTTRVKQIIQKINSLKGE